MCEDGSYNLKKEQIRSADLFTSLLRNNNNFTEINKFVLLLCTAYLFSQYYEFKLDFIIDRSEVEFTIFSHTKNLEYKKAI